MKAQILTPWAARPDNLIQPLLAEFLLGSKFIARNGHAWRLQDVTSQLAENLIPDPNLLAVELECDAATLAAVEADERFYVLWKEQP